MIPSLNPGFLSNGESLVANAVATYSARIAAAGGTLSTTQRNAVTTFVQTGVTNGWWTKLVDCGVFLGSNLAAGLVKLKAASGTPTSYVNNNLVSGDYTESGGITVSGNTNKYLGTGVVPNAHGMTHLAVSMGVGCSSTALNWNGGGLAGTIQTDPALISNLGAVFTGALGHRQSQAQWARSYSAAVSYQGGRQISAHEGIMNGDFTSAPTGLLDTEMLLLCQDKYGARFFTEAGNLSFFFLGLPLTKAELKSITAAARILHAEARSAPVTNRLVSIGDSIMYEQGVARGQGYIAQIANTLGITNVVNMAWSGTQADPAVPESLDVFERTEGIETLGVSKLIICLVTNDLLAGTEARLASVKSKLKQAAQVGISLGAEVYILTNGWRTETTNILPFRTWADACLEAAGEAGGVGIDMLQAMLDDPPATDSLADNVHWNLVGNNHARDQLLYAIANYASFPKFTDLPVISGTVEDGQTVTTTDGTTTGSGITSTYKWSAGALGVTDVSGATANTYLLTADEVADFITSQVKATNSFGAAYARSSLTGPVASAPYDLADLSAYGDLYWADPSDLATLWQDTARTVPVTADGQTVAAFDLKDGLGGVRGTLLQSTAGSRPTYRTSGGLHWLEFDMTADFMETTATHTLGPYPHFIAAAYEVTSDLSRIPWGIGSSTVDHKMRGLSAGRGNITWRPDTSLAIVQAMSGTAQAVLGQKAVVSSLAIASTMDVKVNKNTAVTTAHSFSGSASTPNCRIAINSTLNGAVSNSTDSFFGGIILRGNPGTDRDAVIGHLGRDAGLSL